MGTWSPRNALSNPPRVANPLGALNSEVSSLHPPFLLLSAILAKMFIGFEPTQLGDIHQPSLIHLTLDMLGGCTSSDGSIAWFAPSVQADADHRFHRDTRTHRETPDPPRVSAPTPTVPRTRSQHSLSARSLCTVAFFRVRPVWPPPAPWPFRRPRHHSPGQFWLDAAPPGGMLPFVSAWAVDALPL